MYIYLHVEFTYHSVWQEETAQDMGKIVTAILHAFKKNGRVVKVHT